MTCLSNGDHASLVDARLYLPKDWSDKPDRCNEAGIPGVSRVFKTKQELAYDILLHQLELGTVFEFALSGKLTEQDILKLIINRHYRRQADINRAYIKEFINLSK